MRLKIIEKLIRRDRGDEQFIKYASCSNLSLDTLIEATERTLNSIPKNFGSCVMMSVGLVAVLKHDYSIEAIAVLGDLDINGSHIFKCENNIPMPSYKNELMNEQWDGHCWVEVGNMLCDLSIFRTAYATTHSSLLKSYILSNFGEGNGAFLSPIAHIPNEMEFRPKFVLSDIQIHGVIRGLSAQQNGII